VNRAFYKATDEQHPALPGAAAPSLRAGQITLPTLSAQESSADRTLLMLLALGLMLLAFFVVLTSTASFDQSRIRDVVRSVQATFERPQADATQDSKPAEIDTAHRAAIGVLRAAVASAFASVLSSDTSAYESQDRLNPDRVEIDVPASALFANDEAVLFPLPLLDKVVAVFAAAPADYRMELVVRAAAPPADLPLSQARVAALAEDLTRRGLTPTALSVGTQDQTKGTSASLRFTFLLLHTDDDLAAVQMMTAPKAAP
jgi:hypothetical protein